MGAQKQYRESGSLVVWWFNGGVVAQWRCGGLREVLGLSDMWWLSEMWWLSRRCCGSTEMWLHNGDLVALRCGGYEMWWLSLRCCGSLAIWWLN